MNRGWPEIRHFYAELIAKDVPLGSMHRLIEQIEASRYSRGVYGSTSMLDLIISQHPTSIYPKRDPVLRIAPQFNGRLEFSYLDTFVAARQWTRLVNADQAFSRLERFFEQLHWFG